MADTVRYGKPCMTNLPPDLWESIINQMLNSPKPDEDALEARVRKLEKKMLEARKRKDAQRSATE